LERIKFVATVTVIIPTKNSGRNITRGLEFIRNQSNQQFEILVVVNKSIDDTIEIAKSLKVRILSLEGESGCEKFAFGRVRGEY
jgi:glycosyltransferase involved in cell wall biosynthesis